jgi:hypothetical protein
MTTRYRLYYGLYMQSTTTDEHWQVLYKQENTVNALRFSYLRLPSFLVSATSLILITYLLNKTDHSDNLGYPARRGAVLFARMLSPSLKLPHASSVVKKFYGSIPLTKHAERARLTAKHGDNHARVWVR